MQIRPERKMPLGDVGVDGRILLKLRKRAEGFGLDWFFTSCAVICL
jgi:hypothetical protein